MSYSIIGQVTRDTSLGNAMEGVTMVLQGESSGTVLTNTEGYYRFEDLEEGNYILYPSKQGYVFNPPSISVPLNSGDATGLNFVGIISPADVSMSISSTTIFRPTTSNANKTCSFMVMLDKPLPAGKTATVHYYTANGTAISGQDYQSKNGTLEFLAGQSLMQTVNIGLVPGPSDSVKEYFNLILDNPVNATLTSPVGTCTITAAQNVFLPFVRR
jgi:hypothetical protein